nr:syncytin-A-like [Syngnathus scovelli]
MFTVAPNTSSSIILPMKSLKGFEMVTPLSGSSEEAVFFAKRVTLKNQGTSLLLTLTLPDGKIRPPNATLFNTSCWGFQLWAWSSGIDPRFPITICLNRTMSVADRPVTNNYTLSAGAKITSTLLTDVDSYFVASTEISGHTNNWLLMAEQAAKMADTSCIACMGPRPLLKIIPANIGPKCAVTLMLSLSISPTHDCFKWDKVYPVASMTKYKPLFSSDVAKGNFTCIRLPGTGEKLGALPPLWCGSMTNVTAPFLPIARSDVWFWCNSNKLYDRLPFDSSGICALVTLLLPVHLIPMSSYDLTSFAKSVVPVFWPRTKRNAEWWGAANPTYIDAIGVPRGVPDEYKLVNQIAAGFESALCWWCTINKNVDRINYVHYNVQRLGNWSEAGFKAVHSQLAATSLMAFQNRMALDMLLSKEGGVCAMFGEQCCTFIPNDTAAGGSLSQALEGLRTLNGKMKEHSGVNTEVWTDWLNVFGKYRTLVSSALVSIAVFSAILTLCGCCCIPCLRSLINRLITTAISPPAETFPLLQRDDLSIDAGSFSSDDPVGDSIVVNLSGLFLDPSFADYDSVSS